MKIFGSRGFLKNGKWDNVRFSARRWRAICFSVSKEEDCWNQDVRTSILRPSSPKWDFRFGPVRGVLLKFLAMGENVGRRFGCDGVG